MNARRQHQQEGQAQSSSVGNRHHQTSNRVLKFLFGLLGIDDQANQPSTSQISGLDCQHETTVIFIPAIPPHQRMIWKKLTYRGTTRHVDQDGNSSQDDEQDQPE